MQFKPEDYIQSYGSEGAIFTFQDISSTYYMPAGSINTCLGQKIVSYCSKECLRKMEEVGIKMSPEELQSHASKLEKIIEQNIEDKKLLKNFNTLTKSEIKSIFERFGVGGSEYFYFDMFHWDQVYKMSVTDKEAAKKVAIVQDFKNKIRTKFEDVYFTDSSTFTLLLKQLSLKFSISYEEITWYREQELLALFDKEKLDKSEIEKRKVAYVHIMKETGGIEFLSGIAAKEVIDLFNQPKAVVSELKGKTAHSTNKLIEGSVKIIARDYRDKELLVRTMADMKEGQILVAITTDPEMMPAIKKASAIVTDIGGLLSHSAIVAREFDIPCIVDTRVATKVLKDGDMVEVDANSGIVKILN